MNNKQVGQILFTLSPGEMSLTPVQVVEELVRRTLDGEQVSYSVEALGQNGARRRFNLSSDKFVVFDNIDEAKSYLVDNATKAITMLCEDAHKKSKRLLKDASQENVQKERVQMTESILLEDGTRVKINLP
jgi:hypothetical protein